MRAHGITSLKKKSIYYKGSILHKPFEIFFIHDGTVGNQYRSMNLSWVERYQFYLV